MIQTQGICYLSCDSLTGRSRQELEHAIDFLIDRAKDAPLIYLFLDEITYVKDWVYVLKNLSDSGKTQRMVVVATGSSPASLKRESETLPGRNLTQYFIKPLTFREFVLQVTLRITQYAIEPSLRNYLGNLIEELKRTNPVVLDDASFVQTANQIFKFKKELDYLFNFYLITSGYPFVINHYLERYFNRNERIIDDSVYKEIIQTVLSDLKNLGYQEHIIKQVLHSIIKKIGNPYSYTDLSQATENVTRPTLINYISHLEDSFILNPLYTYDFRTHLAKYKGNKKVYFTDPFILASAKAWIEGKSGYETSEHFQINQIGYLVETIVSQHLIVAHEIPMMRQPETFLWFHSSNRELDFVYKTHKDEFLGIETAYQNIPKTTDIARVSQIKTYLLLTRDEYDEFKRDKELLIMPVSLFLTILERSEQNL